MNCELVLILGYYFVVLVIDEAELDTTTVAIHRNVVGYISVRFTPEALRVSQGDSTTGRVHVTMQPHHLVDNSVPRRLSQPPLRACVVDQSVATASWSTADTDRPKDLATCSLLPSVYLSESTERPEVAAIYSVTVRGVLIGRSALRFYVTKTYGTHSHNDAASSDIRYNQTEDKAYNKTSVNDDLVVTPKDHETQVVSLSVTDQILRQSDTSGVSEDMSYARIVCRLTVNVTDCLKVLDAKGAANYVVSVTQRWWLADEYQIVVISPVRRTTADVLCYLVLTLTALNLVGIGGQLDCDEATQLLRRPSALAVGLFCRFAVMPAVSMI